MSTTVPSHFPLPDLASLPADVRERIEQVQAKAGFIPNVFLVLAHRPAEFRAFFAYHDALMEKEGGLSKAEREMIVVATSAANACEYCVIAHGALVRIYAKRPKLADQLAVNYRTADLSERERLLLDFAVQVAVDSGSVEAEDIEAMRGAGFSDDEIWDIG
ncbi:MAG TPA: peroxidase-related enzyme, partial [Gammaproteobacteria bacterium]